MLVVGAGEMGKLTAQHMRSQGAHRVTIVSRTLAHAARTAEAIGGASAAPWEALDAAYAPSDIVITATGAAAPILTKARVEATMRRRRNRPLFIIDIAMPRDVEPAAGEIEQVFLYNIDDLAADHPREFGAPVERGRACRDDRVRRSRALSCAGCGSRGTIPTVVALRQRFESIRRTELQRLDAKLNGLSPDARARVDEVTRLIVEKLLLTPTEQLKGLSDPDTAGAYAEAVTRVFNLSPGNPAASTTADAEIDRPTDARPTGARVTSFPTAATGSPARAIPADLVVTPPGDLRLGTRGSQLALRQAETVAARIAQHGRRRCQLVIIRTSGDDLQDVQLSEVGGKRLFVKEIEEALLRRRHRPRGPQQQGYAGRAP